MIFNVKLFPQKSSIIYAWNGLTYILAFIKYI